MISDGPSSRGFAFRYVLPPAPFSSAQLSKCTQHKNPENSSIPKHAKHTNTVKSSIRMQNTKALESSKLERKQKGGFVKGWFWRMCPRSGFWCRGTSECTLVQVFGTGEHLHVPSFRFFGAGEHPPKPPFWKPPFCEPPTNKNMQKGSQIRVWFIEEMALRTKRQAPGPEGMRRHEVSPTSTSEQRWKRNQELQCGNNFRYVEICVACLHFGNFICDWARADSKTQNPP